MDVTIVLCSLVLLGAVVQVHSETHTLYYIYTALSKPVNVPGIYEFTAMGLLDDRQIDYYNNKEQKKIPKQDWMREKMPQDYWEKGTQSRKSKEQWFNVNVNILMERMRQNNSDVHVLQWRHGCEIEKQENKITFSKGIDQYSYDGNDFLSFDDKVSQWVAPVDAAVPTKVKWDNVPILNQYTKGYLEKECVDWLNKFREYGEEQLTKVSPPEVHVFARRCTSDKNQLKLTCLTTGFYPKDVTLVIRKYRSSLREDETESSGVRPNHDGTYQLRKSVKIMKDEKADYDCYVTHSTLKTPVIKEWNGECTGNDCKEGAALAIGVAIGVVLTLLVVAAAIGVYLYRRKSGKTNTNASNVQAVLLPSVNPGIAIEVPVEAANGNAAKAEEGASLLGQQADSSEDNRKKSVDEESNADETGSDSGQGSSSNSGSSNNSQENMNKNG